MEAGRRLVVIAAAGALALAACGDDPPATQPLTTTTVERSSDPYETTSTAPTTTPPTAAPLGADPFAVPHDEGAITEEYVEAVLNELARLNGEAVRLSQNAGIMTMEALAFLEAAYSSEELQTQIDILVDDAAAGFPGVLPDPGDRRYEVDEVLNGTLQCIGAIVTVDFSEVAPAVVTPVPVSIELRRAEPEFDDINPTVWQIGRTEVLSGVESGAQPCG